jgi:hypothetical protein
MTERAKHVTADEALDMMRQRAKTLKVGDQIELRSHENFPIDDLGLPPEPPKYRWELVEIIDILPPAPSGDVMVYVQSPGGTKFIQSLARPWRPRAN